MVGAGGVVPALRVGYPWHALPSNTKICDIGGGVGTISLALAGAFPSLQFVLQHMPRTVEQASRLGRRGRPAVRVEFVPIDFLEEAPREECEVYFMKSVLHDWADPQCLAILANVARAMEKKPTSRILIHESILSSSAPEPLLPNYGAGKIRQLYGDWNMICTLNAIERTLAGFVELATESGLEFVKLWDLGEAGLMEFKLAGAASDPEDQDYSNFIGTIGISCANGQIDLCGGGLYDLFACNSEEDQSIVGAD